MDRKTLRLHGQSYINCKGVTVNEKVIGKACKCRQLCFLSVNATIREKLFKEFYMLNSYEEQTKYLAKCINIKPAAKITKSLKRKHTVEYHAGPDGEKICKVAFMSIFAIKVERVEVIKRKITSGIYGDQRGKHENGFHKIKLENKTHTSVVVDGTKSLKRETNDAGDDESIPEVKVEILKDNADKPVKVHSIDSRHKEFCSDNNGHPVMINTTLLPTTHSSAQHEGSIKVEEHLVNNPLEEINVDHTVKKSKKRKRKNLECSNPSVLQDDISLQLDPTDKIKFVDSNRNIAEETYPKRKKKKHQIHEGVDVMNLDVSNNEMGKGQFFDFIGLNSTSRKTHEKEHYNTENVIQSKRHSVGNIKEKKKKRKSVNQHNKSFEDNQIYQVEQAANESNCIETEFSNKRHNELSVDQDCNEEQSWPKHNKHKKKHQRKEVAAELSLNRDEIVKREKKKKMRVSWLEVQDESFEDGQNYHVEPPVQGLKRHSKLSEDQDNNEKQSWTKHKNHKKKHQKEEKADELSLNNDDIVVRKKKKKKRDRLLESHNESFEDCQTYQVEPPVQGNKRHRKLSVDQDNTEEQSWTKHKNHKKKDQREEVAVELSLKRKKKKKKRDHLLEAHDESFEDGKKYQVEQASNASNYVETEPVQGNKTHKKKHPRAEVATELSLNSDEIIVKRKKKKVRSGD